MTGWPRVPWPNGARCAACISWDVDADTLVLHSRPDRGHELYGALSWLRYDEVAVPRIVEALDEFGIKQTFFVCAWCIERYPEMCEPIVASGHEIAHVELPIDSTQSDWPHYAHVPDLGYTQSPKAPATAIEAFRAEFDAAYELGGLWITIWHLHVSGRPARLLAWKGLVEYMLGKGGVWFAKLDEIAEHVRSCVADGTYEPRTVSLLWYDSPPTEFAELALHRRSGLS